MRSRTPKVLHAIAGRAMIDLVVDICLAAGVERPVVVINPSHPEVAGHLEGRCDVVYQREQLGTGHALLQAASHFGDGDLLVLMGDAPAFRPETVRGLLAGHRASGMAATILSVEDPARRDGRVVRRADGSLDRIVEYRDASEAERSISEINAGLYCFRAAGLSAALEALTPDNAAGEIYLTDLFNRIETAVVLLDDPGEAIGVNDRVELARAGAVVQGRILEDLMRAGVTVVDPASTRIDAGVVIGQDTVVEPFTVLRGSTTIGQDCRIGPFTEISDSTIGDRCRIEHSWLRSCSLGTGSDCGPFSKLRPGVEIGAEVHIGSFAELVRTRVAAHSAVPHFSYLGDADIGSGVNIGAGTITANYDGVNKHRTVIEDGVFVGSDSILRAPVRLGRGSRTGAGSVVTKDVPAGATAVGVPARVVRRKAAEAAGDEA